MSDVCVAQLNAGQQQEEDNDSDQEPDTPASASTDASSSRAPVRKRGKSAVVSRFAEPNVVMFETEERALWVDDFGACNEDLVFRDISSIDTKWCAPTTHHCSAAIDHLCFVCRQPKDKAGEPISRPIVPIAPVVVAPVPVEKVSTVEEIPWKLVPAKLRVQFTCEFRELNLSARADLKAIKTLTTKVSPTRLVVLRGAAADCEAVLDFAKAAGIEAHAPANNVCVSFQVLSEKLKVQIPQNLLPGSMKALRVFSAASAGLSDTKCSVTTLGGQVLEARSSAGQEGTRLVKYQGAAAETTELAVGSAQSLHVVEGDEDNSAEMAVDGAPAVAAADSLDEVFTVRDTNIGVVSVGEVTLSSLRQLIETTGTAVEFRLSGVGGILVCDGQVVISKDANNEFVLEGPPVPAFYVARKALYQQFAFV